MSERYSAVPRVVVDGRAFDGTLQAAIARVEVDERDGLPTMLTLTLRDSDRDVLDRASLRIGALVEVEAGPVGESATEVLACAEVRTIEVTYSERQSIATVRAHDLSHRFHQPRRTRSWTDVTDGDVARRIAEDAGVEVGLVDDPGIVHEHLAQIDRSDWDFLTARARDAGRVLRIVGERLELVRHEQAAAAPAPGRLGPPRPGQLVLGAGIESLRGRVTAAEVPSEVEVRGWASETKQPVVASARVSAPGVDIGESPASVAADNPVLVVADRSVTTQQEAGALAATLAEDAGRTFAEAHVVCRGDPHLHAGDPVSIGLAGSLFSGRWTVAAARHVFDDEGYRTVLALGAGPRPCGALPPHRPGPTATSRGPVVGVVTDVADPQGRGRVRVGLPWLSEQYVSEWARVVLPGAGPDRGLLTLPEVDDEVFVAFEQGDERRPYVLGGLHNGQDLPPLSGGDVDDGSGMVRRRGLVSRLGHRLVLDDGTDGPGIALVTGEDHVRIVLDDATRNLTVEAQGDVVVHAGGTISVSGRRVQVSGDQEVSVSAPSISLEADSTLTLRGGLVKIP